VLRRVLHRASQLTSLAVDIESNDSGSTSHFDAPIAAIILARVELVDDPDDHQLLSLPNSSGFSFSRFSARATRPPRHATPSARTPSIPPSSCAGPRLCDHRRGHSALPTDVQESLQVWHRDWPTPDSAHCKGGNPTSRRYRRAFTSALSPTALSTKPFRRLRVFDSSGLGPARKERAHRSRSLPLAKQPSHPGTLNHSRTPPRQP